MYEIDIRNSGIGCWVIIKDGLYDPSDKFGDVDKSLKIHLKSTAHLQTLIAMIQEIDRLEVEDSHLSWKES